MTSPRRPGRSRPIPRGSAGRPLPKPTTHRPAGRLVPTAATRRRPPSAGRFMSSSGLPHTRYVVGIVAVAAVALVVLFNPFKGAPSASPGASGVAGACPTSQPAALPAGETRTVTIETPKGTFKIKVTGSLSPIAAGNFVALAACGYYDGIVFHRVATLDDGTPFVIQGGDPTGQGSGGPGYTITDEPVTATYKRGTVAMARTRAPDSSGSQFFVVLDDKDQGVLASANTYQIFGEVVEGMDVVDAIYKAAGGVELPANPVPMTKVTVSTP